MPGQHNLLNAACCCCRRRRDRRAAGFIPAVSGTTTDVASALRGLETFSGLPQRLEWFAVVDGRRFYNDSAATTPESTVAALEAWTVRWLLAGGADKGCDFGPLVEAIARRTRGVALFGAVAGMLQGRIAAEDPRLPCVAVGTMAEALQWCWDRSQVEDRILLSPACSSHDQFCNFRQRGEQFVALVSALAADRNVIE